MKHPIVSLIAELLLINMNVQLFIYYKARKKSRHECLHYCQCWLLVAMVACST